VYNYHQPEMILYVMILTSWHVTQLCRAAYTAGNLVS